ncbi:MAG: phosphate ABC transporter permease PstA [Xanthomonadales bacterium]|nr:phosphate ABC transporter permease PstA [Xanthomonadales bacterium]
MTFRNWMRGGAPWVWLNSAAVSACILLVVGLVLLIAFRGAGHFWPRAVYEIAYQPQDGARITLVGQMRDREDVKASRLRESGLEIDPGIETVERILLKTGNRDSSGEDFRWIIAPAIVQKTRPLSMVVMEREEWGMFFGRVVGLERDGEALQSAELWSEFQAALERATRLREQIEELEKGAIGSINYQLERLRLEERKLQLKGVQAPEPYEQLSLQRQQLNAQYRELESELFQLNESIRRDTVIAQTGDGQEVEMSLAVIIDAWKPNAMGGFERVLHYFVKAWDFVSEDPREANTEGGVFPAIFGTVLMVLLMTVVVAPFGVVAGVYLKEYARQGPLTRTIRIAVNNLAGVPSIVYGVFGLGFFVYTLGGGIDKLFFEAALPSPTFGTGGLFWAALTLALLTLPVVIVSTEEGLARIPRSLREGSLALGATQWETLWRTVIPMASPGIMTGLILAVARAAGEVAPLMLVGVVKLAPSLPLDGNYPYLHLERKFMHLGFHIYDVGFQSPNVEAARPLVYATALLLIIVILLLNLVAIRVRNGLREKYKGLEA